MANNRIDYSIGFKVDQTGLNQAKSALQELQRLSAGDLMKINNTSFDQAKKDLKELKANASVLENALNKAFNANLGTVNVSKFNQELKKSNITLDQIYAGMSKAGYAGEAAFRKTATQVLTTNTQLKQSHKILDDIAKTMGNTIKWGIASSAMNTFTGSIQKAYGYVKHLDTSLNDIRIVTEKSAEQMDTFAIKANKAAKDLRASTTDYTEAALIYYQQGLADKEVQARTDSTLKAANVTGQSGAEVSEQLTAVWNGYKVSAQETELYVDKLAAVAASTASDLEELSTGMSKVASAAAASGVDIDQLNGHLSTVISVTRQAPETVGTAFKTIYARLGDLAVDGEDEFGTKLGEVSNKLKIMGIDILDSQGQMREMGTVMEEVAEKWDGWTQAQRQAAAVAMAGKRQYNNLIALFDNWDMYTDAVNTSVNAMGTLQTQQDIYMESTAAHLQRMQTSWEGVYDSVLDTDTINFWLDAFAGLGTGLEHLVDGLGGGNNALLLLGSTAMKVFDKQIANSLSITLNNFKRFKEQAENTKAIMETQTLFKGQKIPDEIFNGLVNMKQEVLSLGSIVSETEHQTANALIQATYEAKEQAAAWDDNLASLTAYANSLDGINFDSTIKNTSGDASWGDSTDIEALNNALTEQEARISKSQKALGNYSSSLDSMSKHLQNVGWDQEDNAIEQYENRLRALAGTIRDYKNNLPEAEQRALTRALQDFDAAIDEEGRDLDLLKEKLIQAFDKQLKNDENNVRHFADVLEQEIKGASNAFGAEVDRMEQQWKEFQTALQQKSNIANVVNLIGTMGQLASAIQTIINLGSVWQNEDLSTGEKLLQTISSLGMTLPMLTMNLGQAKDGLMLIGGKLGIVDKAFFEAMGNAQGLTAKLGVLKGALGTLVRSFGPYIAIAAVAVGAATALYMWWTKDERAAKKAAEGATKAAQALEQVKAEQQEITDTLTAYQDATDAMKDLTVGTQEWTDALNEANSSVLSLMETFPELAEASNGYMKTINGQLVLTEKGQEYVQEQTEGRIEAAQNALFAANANSLEAENTSATTDFARSVQVGTGAHGQSTGTLSSDVVNRAVDAINTSGGAYLQSVETIQETLGVGRDVAQALYDNKTGLMELAGKVSANTAAQEAYYQQIATSYLKDSETYENATDTQKTMIADASGSYLQAEADKLYQDKYRNAQMTDKDAQEAYAEMIGAEDVKNKSGNKGEYLINGEWQTITDEAARMALAMQEASEGVNDFAQKVIETSNSIIENNEKLNLSNDTMTAVMGFNGETGAVGNVSALSTDELNDLNNIEFTEEEAKALGYETAEKLMQAIDDAVAAEMGRRAEENAVQANEAVGTMGDHIAAAAQDKEWTKEQDDAIREAGGSYGLIQSYGGEEALADYATQEGVSVDQILAEIDWSQMPSEGVEEWFKGAVENGAEQAQIRDKLESNYSEDASAYGFDEETYRNLTERIQETADESDALSDSLEENEQAAQEVAKDILRFDKALESVNENSEDWYDTLENGTLQEQSEIVDEVADAYGNLLDIDGSQLSDDFLTNAENMKLMQEAANGSEEAYNQLAAAARQDIIANCKMNDAEFQSKFANLMEQTKGVGLEDIEVGASLKGDGFLNGLTQLVNAAGMTAQQATDYLSSMGVDAEIEEVTAESEESNEYTGAEAKVTNEPVTYHNPIDDSTVESSVPSITYTPKKVPVKGKKETKGTSLKVTAASKSSGGGFKFKNSTHGGGSKGKSGGGGGGGGGSTPTRTTKSSGKKFNRYRKVDNNLSKLTTELEKLTKAQDKLFGKDLLNNLNKQLKVIKQQVTQTKKKLDLAKAEAKEMRTQRKANYKDENGYTVKNDLKDFGIKFDKDTKEITNYASKMKWYDNEIAKLEKQWNNMSAKEQESNKSLGNRIEALKNNRDTLEELVANYDELIYDKIPGLEDELTEAAYQQIEIKLQAFEVEANLRLEVTEAIKDWDDFKKEMLEFETAESLGKAGTLSTEGAQLVRNSRQTRKSFVEMRDSGFAETKMGDLKDLQKEQEAWRKNKKGYKGEFAARDSKGNIMKDDNGNVIFDEKALREKMKEAEEQLKDYTLQMEEWQQEATENLLNAIDLVGDAYARQQDTLDFIGSQIEHQLKMTELIKGEGAYEDMKDAYADAAKNAEKMAATKEEEMNYYYKKMTQSDLTAEEREKWEEMYYAAAEEYSSLLEESVEAFKAQFENEVRAEAEKLFGPDNSKEQAEWEIQTKLDDEYLDQIDKAYELTTLENKMQEGLNKAGSTSAQKKINELMDEELEKLREKDKLTQYDIDRANARYELELKKIALEEAQNNKSQMRLRRDASGNYSYQFTADEDAIANAEQEVNDAQQGLREMDLEEQKRLQEKLFELQKEYKDKWIEYNLLTEEEQKARQAEYQVYFDYYQSELGVSAERLGEVQKNTAQSTFDQAQTLYAQDKANFGELNADLKAILEDKTKTANDLTQSEIDMVNKELTPAWTGAAKEIAAKWSPDGNMTSNITKSQNKINKKQKELNDKLDEFGKKSKTSSDKSIEAAKKTLTQQKKVTKELKNQVKELEDIKRAVDDEAAAWDKLKKKIMDALAASNKYLKETAKKDADDIKDGKNKKTTKKTTTKTTGKSTKDGGNNDGGDGIPEIGDTVIFKSGKYHSDSYGGGPHGSRGIGKKTKINIINKGAPYPIHVQSSTGAYGWLKKEQLKGFDTGGYTGKWSGGEGKVAMLHSKELVLNAKDTENMLAMITMVRELEGAFKASSKTNSNEAQLKELKKALNKAQDQQKELEKQAKYLKELTELQKEQKKLVKNQENAQKKELAQLEKALDKVVKEMSSEMKKTTASSKTKAADKKSTKPVKAKAKKTATSKAKLSKTTTAKKATTAKKGSGTKKAAPKKADLMKELQQAAKAIDKSKLSKDQKKALMNELDKFAKQTDKGQRSAKEVDDFLKDVDKVLNKTKKGGSGGKAKSVTSKTKTTKSTKAKASGSKKVTSTKQKDLDKAKAAKAAGAKAGKGSGSGGSNKLTKSSGGKGTKVVTSKAKNIKSGKGSGSGGTKVKNKKLSNIEQLQAQIKDLDKAEKELQKQLKNAKKNSAKEKALKKQIEKLEKKEKQAKDKLQKEQKALKDKQNKAAKEKALKDAKNKQKELEKELAEAKKKADQAEKEAKNKAKETKKEVEADLEQIKKIQEAELAYKAKLQEYYNLTEEERLAQRDEYLKSFTEYQKAIETANGKIKDKDLMQAVLAVGLKSSDSNVSFGELGAYSTTGEASGNSVQLSEDAIIQNENMQLLSAQLEEAKASLAEIHSTDLVELLTVLKEMSGYVKTAKTSLYNIRHTDFVKLMEQLAITDNRVRLGRLSLYNIRHKDFVKLLGYFEEKKKDTATANQGRKVPKITTDLASGAAMTAMQKSLEKAMHSATKSVLQTSKLLNVLEQKTLNNLYNEKKNEVQQAITINAEFPNAADVKAISDALDSLVNQATQRAFTTIK